MLIAAAWHTCDAYIVLARCTVSARCIVYGSGAASEFGEMMTRMRQTIRAALHKASETFAVKKG